MAWSSPRTWTTGETVTAAHLNQEIRDNILALFPNEDNAVDWDPTLFAVSGGASVSSLDGYKYPIGAMMFLGVRWVISAIGSGEYYAELPAPAVGIVQGQVLGSVFIQDSSASVNNEVGVALLVSGTPQQVRFAFAGGNATPTHPVNLTTGDILGFDGKYPIA